MVQSLVSDVGFPVKVLISESLKQVRNFSLLPPEAIRQQKLWKMRMLCFKVCTESVGTSMKTSELSSCAVFLNQKSCHGFTLPSVPYHPPSCKAAETLESLNFTCCSDIQDLWHATGAIAGDPWKQWCCQQL